MAEAEIKELFTRWNDALQTGDPDAVVRLYGEDAILLPTVSNRVRHNHAEIRDYFVTFLAKRPFGMVDESNVREIGDVAIHSGSYTFDLTSDGVASRLPCRFTFVYHKVGGEWTIVEHHSSAMPE